MENSLDALLPHEIALRAEDVGVKKANTDALSLFVLAVLAGAFVALGAVFSTTVVAGANGTIPYGISKLLFGLVFCLGLILVIVAGAELFTGNNLLAIAWASRRITTAALMCNALVCLAVWLTFGARTTTDKILAILFPITAFAAVGFEHSIANM